MEGIETRAMDILVRIALDTRTRKLWCPISLRGLNEVSGRELALEIHDMVRDRESTEPPSGLFVIRIPEMTCGRTSRQSIRYYSQLSALLRYDWTLPQTQTD